MSKLLVVKFGGSSLESIELLRHAAKVAIEAKSNFDQLCVVVSAMGNTTDNLYELVHQTSANPSERELDRIVSTGELVSSALLAILLNEMGHPARSVSGQQAGILTDDVHGAARIKDIDTNYLKQALDNGEIPIITGFQGFDSNNEITTLGRGGSDTTAAAIAVALKADECRIYTDVKGVYTADPRICHKARIIEVIYFEEMLELAAMGAQVLHPRAVEFAGRNKLLLRVMSTAESQEPGTRIVFELEEIMEKSNITGVAYNLEEAKITVRALPDKPGIAARIFSEISENNIDVDMVVQNNGSDGLADISFTVHRSQATKAQDLTSAIAKEIGAGVVECANNVGKISLVGVGMRGNAGIAAQMFSTLSEAEVNIQMISTSEIKISAIIDEDKVELAVRRLHRDFDLDAEAEVGVVSPAINKK